MLGMIVGGFITISMLLIFGATFITAAMSGEKDWWMYDE